MENSLVFLRLHGTRCVEPYLGICGARCIELFLVHDVFRLGHNYKKCRSFINSCRKSLQFESILFLRIGSDPACIEFFQLSI